MTGPDGESYGSLKAAREQEWAQRQAVAAQQIRDLQAHLRTMPDVLTAPHVGTRWSDPEVLCPECNDSQFIVRIWNLVNGVKYRAELGCLGCDRIMTWDWPSRSWIG